MKIFSSSLEQRTKMWVRIRSVCELQIPNNSINFIFLFFCDNGKIQQKGGEPILKRDECILNTETIFVLSPPIVNISSSASLCRLASDSTGSMGWFHWLPCSVHLDSVTAISIPSSLMCQNPSLLTFPILTWWSWDSAVVFPAVGSHWLRSIQSQNVHCKAIYLIWPGTSQLFHNFDIHACLIFCHSPSGFL